MCGIWGYIMLDGKILEVTQEMYNCMMSLRPRGPDKTTFMVMPTMALGFHRLAIMDLSSHGDQPFIMELADRTIYWMCNGEIYEYDSLVHKYGLEDVLESSSDCEIIGYIYKLVGLKQLCDDIKGGEFACVIVDVPHGGPPAIHFIRDPLGVRPLFIGYDTTRVVFSSEYKGIGSLIHAVQMPSGCAVSFIDGELVLHRYHHGLEAPEIVIDDRSAQVFVRNGLISSVESMLGSDRPMGALLSGGLDSSLIVAIASRYLAERGKQLHTFSIGMPGATDREYAEMVAKHCNTLHTHIELTSSEFLDAIHDVIRCIESPDITTIRASVGQYLVSKTISQRYGIKVLLIGDGSDELFGGYLYFHKAPNASEFRAENIKLLENIKYYDVLRADRGVAGNGIEARVPFLKCTYVDMVLSLPAQMRMPSNGVEKWLLRTAFSDTGLLPEAVLWRKKEAFSDGVSSVTESWYSIIQKMANDTISDAQFNVERHSYLPFELPTKESLYFMKIFIHYYPDGLGLIPGYWLPSWVGNIKEPSARVLGL